MWVTNCSKYRALLGQDHHRSPAEEVARRHDCQDKKSKMQSEKKVYLDRLYRKEPEAFFF